jgi:phosphatidylglycerol---prolipoprotein diacylglyceryl transferase
VSPDIVTIGPFTIRWYGLLFALSFIVGFQIMTVFFRKEKRNENDLNDLIWYMILATVLGARLGHCFFYNPVYYLSHPLEILMVWKGGLASHGAAIGILTAIYLFVKKKKEYTFLWILDRIVITAALAGFFIRMGNLFNSEILGKQSDVPWAFIFASVDNVPRHPAQLYEAIAYLIVFGFLFWYYNRTKANFKPGMIFGLFLVLVFLFRFFVEFIKEDQTYFEQGMVLNMGQLLSIPLIFAGLFLVFRKGKASTE